jgi:hypothetical protein
MRRRNRSAGAPVEAPTGDSPRGGEHERFWEGDELAELDHATAFAAVAEDESLEYGRKARPDAADVAALAELAALAGWAEDKACRPCRTTMEETHNPARLEHDECRAALRVARLLSRYPI